MIKNIKDIYLPLEGIAEPQPMLNGCRWVNPDTKASLMVWDRGDYLHYSNGCGTDNLFAIPCQPEEVPSEFIDLLLKANRIPVKEIGDAESEKTV